MRKITSKVLSDTSALNANVKFWWAEIRNCVAVRMQTVYWCLFLYWLPFCLTLKYSEIAHPSEELKGHFSYKYLSVDLHMLLLLNVPRHAQTGNAMLLQFIHLKQYLIWYYDDILYKKMCFFSSVWYIWIIYEQVSHCSLLPSLNGWFMRTIMHM